MSLVNEPHTPSLAAKEASSSEPSRIGKLKLAFLYVLIGGLAASALTAIIALLIGSFNSEIQKSLLTIFVFFSHSLFILALLWADKYNEVGRNVLPTSIFGLALANMITTTLSTWEIISTETAWRALGLYFLIIGAVFIITGILKLRLNHKATKAGLYTSIGSITVLVITLAPWVLHIVDRFDPLYFRSVAALSIFSSTAFLIAIILRGIALARHPELKATIPATHPIPGNLLAIYITVGTITAMVWCSGLAGFLISAVENTRPAFDNGYNRYY
ncbi:MAG: hypothetical protein JWO54_955 [Candidatus Saccharibacteria bacterium]|jgi:hypothetical protein|nr:hypothetical protein [Candidatus Saccharibacteria bacterium]MDB5181192.1 hypothetical protein [Candidatus Saccharibacteria bacterium]